ncbi:MAG: hypothetical protein KFF50_06135 [Desulfatitalea sp.]|nr:hypothetical protein [Desulfatitalea sp.]
MTIAGISEVASRGGQVSSSEKQQVMGKDDFLHLLVAQLKSQDPLNPMDGTEFTAQLAQFSSLEQLQNINGALGTLASSQAVLTNSQAVAYIGKNITAVGDSFQVQDGQSPELHFSLDHNAFGLYARIYDSHGNFIRQVEGGHTAAGDNRLTWDGYDYLGGRAPDGDYYFEVSAIDEQGNSVQATTFASGLVTAVQFKNGQSYLQCGSREIPMGNVVSVMADNKE